MKKFIVTTTIYEPTPATLKYAEMEDWTFIVVGDLKTPHDSYKNLNLIYLSPDVQQSLYPKVSELIGWNCIMRRNLGFLHAYKLGADIVASIDDDNIPYENWGKDVRVGTEQLVDVWDCNSIIAFDPMKMTNYSHLWHRGYPISHLSLASGLHYEGKQTKKILFQADLWDGDPDVDAICRQMYWPVDLKLKVDAPFTSELYMPFNSQNTFIAREALPYYMVLPHVGRVDDIWGGYIAEYLLDTRPLFMPPTTYQKRNEQSIKKNLEDEMYGYVNTYDFLFNIEDYVSFLPNRTAKALIEYRNEYDRIDNS
jgi:hypothetical protein